MAASTKEKENESISEKDFETLLIKSVLRVNNIDLLKALQETKRLGSSSMSTELFQLIIDIILVEADYQAKVHGKTSRKIQSDKSRNSSIKDTILLSFVHCSKRSGDLFSWETVLLNDNNTQKMKEEPIFSNMRDQIKKNKDPQFLVEQQTERWNYKEECDKLKTDLKTILQLREDECDKFKTMLQLKEEECDKLKADLQTFLQIREEECDKLKADIKTILHLQAEEFDKLNSDIKTFLQLQAEKCDKLKTDLKTVIQSLEEICDKLKANGKTTLQLPEEECDKLKADLKKILQFKSENSKETSDTKILDNKMRLTTKLNPLNMLYQEQDAIYFTPELHQFFCRKETYPKNCISFLKQLCITFDETLTIGADFFDILVQDKLKCSTEEQFKDILHKKLQDFRNMLITPAKRLAQNVAETDWPAIIQEMFTFIRHQPMANLQLKGVLWRFFYVLTQLFDPSTGQKKEMAIEFSQSCNSSHYHESNLADKDDEQQQSEEWEDIEKYSMMKHTFTTLFEIEETEETHEFHRSENCKKNPGHLKFIHIENLDINMLPKEYRNEALLNYIKSVSELTVKVEVKHVSSERPELLRYSCSRYPLSNRRGKNVIRCGTGTVTAVRVASEELDCPCVKCKKQNAPSKVVGIIRVLTSRHVVFDQSEAETAICKLGYGKEDSEAVTLHVTDIDKSEHGTDLCELTCVTCDSALLLKVKKATIQNSCNLRIVHKKLTFPKKTDKFIFIVSHPHGLPKRVSFGYFKLRQVSFSQHSVYTYDTPTCPGSSGALVNIVQKTPDKYRFNNSHVHSGSSRPGLNQSGLGREYLPMFYSIKAIFETLINVDI